ncbi:MAG TPA: nucleotidyltransferase family protein [Candidatus Nitrosotenuis sp.]|nr:nucleotidyltransferase family protein [Candidatus Nitrosotenuis sp.]
MHAIILAGGIGTRLKPITDYVPKPLIPINNIPIIEWQITYLKKHGINKIIICSGYKAEQIQNYLKHKNNFGTKIRYSIEKTPLGTGGAIKKAARLINDKSFLVLNGDVITNIDLKKMLVTPNSIALVELRTKFGTVSMSGNKIVDFKEKKPLKDIWMNSGIYHLDKKIVKDLPSKGSIEEDTFHKYAKNGKLNGVKFEDALWFSIDSHKDIDECASVLKNAKFWS